MELNKAHFVTNGDQLELTMPLSKIDEENRIVSGFATLDNNDKQDDVLTAEASLKAFQRFRGNVRSMHEKVPAGKVVNFREEDFFDTETEQSFKGIYVDAYISKGAPNIWEMVLDGTLSGFSIGGNALKTETKLLKDSAGAEKSVRFVTDYELTELSLVDSPANHLANIMSIKKSVDGSKFIDGLATELSIENIFYCNTDKLAKATEEAQFECVSCGLPMENIGWFENDDVTTKTEKILKVLTNKNLKGGVNKMAKDKLEHGDNKKQETTANNASANDLEVVYDPTKEEVKAAKENEDVTEVQENALDLEKVITELKENLKTLNDSLVKNTDSHNEALRAVEERIEKFEGELTKLAGDRESLTEKFDSLSKNLSTLEKKLEAVEGETAMRKSGELGDSPERMEKRSTSSKWGGQIFSTSDLDI